MTRKRGISLFSVEAYYHPSCRKEYTRQAGLGRSEDDEQRAKQFKLEQAHTLAFEKVCNLIQEMVIIQQEIMKLHDLCRYYTGLLETTNFPNTDYRAEKMNAKLQKHDIGNKISFTSFEQGSGKYSSQLVLALQ